VDSEGGTVLGRIENSGEFPWCTCSCHRLNQLRHCRASEFELLIFARGRASSLYKSGVRCEEEPTTIRDRPPRHSLKANPMSRSIMPGLSLACERTPSLPQLLWLFDNQLTTELPDSHLVCSGTRCSQPFARALPERCSPTSRSLSTVCPQ